MPPHENRQILLASRPVGIPQPELVRDFEHRHEEAVTRLAVWVRSGLLRYREEVLEESEHAPASLRASTEAGTPASG